MFESSSDDLFQPLSHEEMVGNLLSSQQPDCASLAAALLPLVVDPCSSPVPWVCSTRYKTELCTSYAAGFCKYAERCQFAHGLHDLHVPSRHPKYKTELCRSYHVTGHCYYGTRCLFVHGAAEQLPAVRRRRRRTVPCRTFASYGVCPFGTRCNFLHVAGQGGGCHDDAATATTALGNSCSTPPESPGTPTSPTLLPPPSREWKPRGALCRTFSAFGFCLYGTRCRFQHGLPDKMRGPDADLFSLGLEAAFSPQMPGGRPFSPGSEMPSSASSTSSSPPQSASPSPLAEATAHNAFTFASQHLNGLLLPLVLHLQQLENGKAMAASAQEIWNTRAL